MSLQHNISVVKMPEMHRGQVGFEDTDEVTARRFYEYISNK